MTLKFSQGYRNHITSFPHPNNISLADLSKSMHCFTRYTTDKAHFYSLNKLVTMKIWSMLPNSDQIVYLFIYPNDAIHEAWSESIIWFKCLGADKILLCQNLTFKVPMWPWKWDQDHQNLTTSFSYTKGISIQVWSKSIYWFRRQNADKAHFYSLYSVMTVKIRSRSTNFNQIFSLSQWYNT